MGIAVTGGLCSPCMATGRTEEAVGIWVGTATPTLVLFAMFSPLAFGFVCLDLPGMVAAPLLRCMVGIPCPPLALIFLGVFLPAGRAFAQEPLRTWLPGVKIACAATAGSRAGYQSHAFGLSLLVLMLAIFFQL